MKDRVLQLEALLLRSPRRQPPSGARVRKTRVWAGWHPANGMAAAVLRFWASLIIISLRAGCWPVPKEVANPGR